MKPIAHQLITVALWASALLTNVRTQASAYFLLGSNSIWQTIPEVNFHMSALAITPYAKVNAIASILSGIAIPVAIAWASHYLAVTLKQSENELKYIEIATSIIREDPKDSTSALRDWAVDVLAHNSRSVPLTEAAKKQLKDTRVKLSSAGYAYSYEDYAGIGDAGSYGTSGGDVISLGKRAAQPSAPEGRYAGKPASRP